MTIRRTTVIAIAAGSAGSAVGQGVSEHVADGIVDKVHLNYLPRLAFTSGSEEPLPGAEIEGATGGATGKVIRVVKTSGNWEDGNAAGNIYITEKSGTFQSENLDNNDSGTANFATISADSTAVVNTTDAVLAEAIANPSYGPAGPVLSVANNNTSGWYYPRVTVQDAEDGADIVGPVDYVSVGSQVRLSLAGANPADAVMATIVYDDERH